MVTVRDTVQLHKRAGAGDFISPLDRSQCGCSKRERERERERGREERESFEDATYSSTVSSRIISVKVDRLGG